MNTNVIKYSNPIVIKYGTPIATNQGSHDAMSSEQTFTPPIHYAPESSHMYWSNMQQLPVASSSTILPILPNTTVVSNSLEDQDIREKVTRNCLVCHYSISINSDLWRDAYNDFTSTSFKQLSDVIKDLMNEINQDIKKKTTTIICMNCFLLIDKLDDLQNQIQVK